MDKQQINMRQMLAIWRSHGHPH